MQFTTPSRLFDFQWLAALVVFAGLASGCQSSRPRFSFQPTPSRVRPATVAMRPPTATASAETLVAPAPAVAAAQPDNYRVVGHTPHHLKPPTHPAVGQAATMPDTRPLVKRVATLRPRVLLNRPHATAEAGLGTTVLGVLGLVVLPIALIGLAISGGGLVWGIVAGAAALAVLVAYIDPFGRR
jgi:hypothetical protein